jgi:1-acyl-sn-glycerol-3-phosphate acyltransferase
VPITWLARAIAHIFYRVDVVGAPPSDGPLLLLPNHPNALLDPALVIATARRPVRFLAKSTLFKSAFGPLMRAAGAIPVYRKQDAAEVQRNAESFAAVDAALARGEAVCIFPEGISHSSGMLEPLRTGAARMALSAAAAGADLHLVAVGINLERKVAFRSRVTIAYGQPMAVTNAAGPPSNKDSVHALTAGITERMRSLLVEAEPMQDAALVERLHRLLQSERQAHGREEALERRRLIAEGLQRLRRERPEWYEQALVQLRRYDDRLRRFGMADAALDWDLSHGAAWRFAARELPLGLVLLPIAWLAIAVFAVPYAVTDGAAKLSKDMDVTATMKVLGGLAIYGAWVGGISVAAGWFWGAAGALAALFLLPSLAVAGLFALEREASAWQTARSWLAVRSAHPTTTRALKRRRAELALVLEQIYETLSMAGDPR